MCLPQQCSARTTTPSSDRQFRQQTLARAVTAALCLSLSPVSQAAVFTVTNNSDAGPGSLRQAVLDANASAGADEIQFDGVSGTIDLLTGSLDVAESLAINGPGRDVLAIDAGLRSRILLLEKGTLTVSGLTLQRGLTPNGEGGGAVGFVCQGSTAEPQRFNLVDSTIKNSQGRLGAAVGSYCVVTRTQDVHIGIQRSLITGNDAGSSSIIHFNNWYQNIAATVEIVDSQIDENTGNAVELWNRYNYDASLNVTIVGSSISNNIGDGLYSTGRATQAGPTSVTVIDSQISGNSGVGIAYPAMEPYSPGQGEQRLRIENAILADNEIGLYTSGLEFDIVDTTISGNTTLGLQVSASRFAGYHASRGTIRNTTISNNGTGLSIDRGSVATIENSLITGNRDAGVAVAVSFWDTVYGNYGLANLRNSTISANLGPGIKGTGYDRTMARLEHTTVTGNMTLEPGGGLLKIAAGCCGVSQPFAIINNSLIADNTGDASAPDIGADVEIAYSLVGDSTGASITETVPSSNLFDMDPRLGPLQDNGGPTLTHQLLPGSPAIDAGNPSFLPPPYFDQRGDLFARVVNGRTDIGAFEVQGTDTVAPSDAGMARCLGDISRDGVIDIAHVDPEGQTDIRGLNNRFVKAVRFNGIDNLVEVEVVPSSRSVGANELLTVGANRTEVRDPRTGFLISGQNLAVTNIDAEWLQDYNGNGAPELALLNADAPKVELSESPTSAMLDSVYFTSYFEPKDLEIIEDLNGNGSPELALLGDNLDPSKGDRVEIRDPETGEKLKVIWLGKGWRVLEHAFLADFSGNGYDEVAVMRIDDANGSAQVQLRDSDTGQRLRDIGLGSEYPPQQLLVIPDINGNGADEIVVFGQRFNNGNQKARVLDAKTGELLREIFFNKEYAGQDFSRCTDINGNGSEELLLLGQRTSDGRLKAFVKDSKTGELLGRLDF